MQKLEFFVLLLAIPQLGVNCDSNGGRCLTCADYNRLSFGQCINSYHDCGGCKPRFIQDDADARLCIELELFSSPSDVSIEIGNSVHLPCVFSATVDCYWTKDDCILAIGGHSRYQYADTTTDGDNRRRDCSLFVAHVSDRDAGQWTCGSVATSDLRTVQSTPFIVSVTSRHNVDIEPETKESESDINDVIATAMTSGHGQQAVNIAQQTQFSSSSVSTNDITTLKYIIIPAIIVLIAIVCLFGFMLIFCCKHFLRDKDAEVPRNCQGCAPTTRNKHKALENLKIYIRSPSIKDESKDETQRNSFQLPLIGGDSSAYNSNANFNCSRTDL